MAIDTTESIVIFRCWHLLEFQPVSILFWTMFIDMVCDIIDAISASDLQWEVGFVFRLNFHKCCCNPFYLMFSFVETPFQSFMLHFDNLSAKLLTSFASRHCLKRILKNEANLPNKSYNLFIKLSKRKFCNNSISFSKLIAKKNLFLCVYIVAVVYSSLLSCVIKFK